MLGIFNVLVAGIAARMTGDERGMKVDAEAIVIGVEGQAAVSVLRGNVIGVGVERDAELAGSDRGRGARDIIGMWIEPRQMRTLFLQHVEGSLMRLAVDARIGDGVEPDLRGGLDGAELAQLQSTQEVLLDVTNTRLHAALLIGARNVARLDRKAVVTSEVEIAGIEHRCDAGEALQHGRS